jgi:hypothetical protein
MFNEGPSPAVPGQTYMIILPDSQTPIFKSESQLTQQDIGYFLNKIVAQFNHQPDYIKELFIELLAKATGAPMKAPEKPLPYVDEPVYTLFPGTIQQVKKKASEFTHEDISYFIVPVIETFTKSPLLARDYFTRAVLEQYGIHIPGEVPEEKKESSLILPDYYNTNGSNLIISTEK